MSLEALPIDHSPVSFVHSGERLSARQAYLTEVLETRKRQAEQATVDAAFSALVAATLDEEREDYLRDLPHTD